MDPLPILSTERTFLRLMAERDFSYMRELDQNSEVVRYLGHGKVRSEEETSTNMAKIFSDYETHWEEKMFNNVREL